MKPPPGLDAFLAALRTAGIPVGPDEVARLGHAFAQAPALERVVLKEILACTLVKSPEQREEFDELFEEWVGPEDAWIAPDPTPAESAWLGDPGHGHRPSDRRAKVRAPKTRRRIALATVAGLMALALAWTIMESAAKEPEQAPQASATSPEPESATVGQPTPTSGDEGAPPVSGVGSEDTQESSTAGDQAPLEPLPLPSEPVASYETWIPTVTWELPLRLPALALLLLAAGSLGTVLGLWARYSRRYRLPAPATATRAGPDLSLIHI